VADGAVTRIGINGFGRMGRLALRAAWGRPGLDLVHVNELHGDAQTGAHLAVFDSVHGRWDRDVRADGSALTIDGKELGYSGHGAPGDVPWHELGVDLVLECTGAFRSPEKLAPYFERGVRKVVVAAPVKDDARLNVVVGVNDHLYDPAGTTSSPPPRARRTASPRWSRWSTRASGSGTGRSPRCTT
jgi:glyceraldehyde 3-phosphate dehydrogenase